MIEAAFDGDTNKSRTSTFTSGLYNIIIPTLNCV